MVQKTLYILRHAKAETGVSYQDDHARGLTERGVQDAGMMGKYLLRHHIVPDSVLCSTAERASWTWQHVQEAFAHSPQVEYSERLYLASANEILNQVIRMPETINSVMVVGHNPGLHQLCIKLAKEGDEELTDSLTLKFPTCAFATITFGDIHWSDIAQVRGTLAAFVTPRMIEASAH